MQDQSLSAGGGSVMSSFVQNKPFYSGRDIFYLKPKKTMTLAEKLFYCMCLRANKYKFSFGRQANKTLKTIDLPDEIPSWVYKTKALDLVDIKESLHNKNIKLTDRKWSSFRYDRFFKIESGIGGRRKDISIDGKIPLITAIDENNGLIGFVKNEPKHADNVISVVRNGENVATAFYQSKPFCSTEDVHIFNPKGFTLNSYVALFLIPLIKKEKYRYSYGRKWGISRMNETKIMLPIDNTGNPDWKFMEDYVKSLPYSRNL